MANTQFACANKQLVLHRYPKQHEKSSLQAWGPEDEYLLEYVNEQIATLGNTLILNDDFGALGCALSDNNIVWQSDSYIATRAFEQNTKENGLAQTTSILLSTEQLRENFDTVLLKIPRNHKYLAYQLGQLQNHISESTQIIATAKAKMVTKPVLQLFEQYIGSTQTSLAKKKSRLVFCSPDNQKQLAPPSITLASWVADINKLKPLCIDNYVNVFSATSLDIGARFMLEHLAVSGGERIIDLGCGNGVLGLSVLIQNDSAHVTFVDESAMAVACAKHNVEAAMENATQRAKFIIDNCLQSQPDGKFDRVLCNPPFHQQNSLTDHVAWQMFSDAKRCLRKGGLLQVVGNRHLSYHNKLKRLFGGVKVLASHPKFVILNAYKKN